MAEDFDEVQTEIKDKLDSSPENKVGTVGTSPITIQRTDNKDCTAIHVHNPVLGVRKNEFADVIYVTVDGSDPATYGETIIIGDSLEITGKIANGNLKIVSNNAGTYYEITMVG